MLECYDTGEKYQKGKREMTESILMIVVDLLFSITGAAILWLVSFGRFKFIRPARTTLAYFGLSLVGAIFWIILISLILLGT